MTNKNNQKIDCCKTNTTRKPSGFWAGIAYGLLPHTGCIAFIIFTVLGVTAATTLLKPLLLNPYFFYILIGLSLVLATVSAAIYLRKNNCLSTQGIRRKWGYLSILYGTTIVTNLLLFMVVFPFATNFVSAQPITGAATAGQRSLAISVDIPCPGHAPLITGELNTIQGVTNVKFGFPNNFDVTYDATRTSKEQILGLDVFDTYPATVLRENAAQASTTPTNQPASQPASGCGCGAR